MVVMDGEDYTDKALSLLADSNTYNNITKEPTTKLKNKLAQILRDIKNQGGFSDHSYRKVYPTSAVAPKLNGLSQIHKVASPLGPLYSVGDPLHVEWPRSWQTSFAHWLVSLHTILKTSSILCNTSKRQCWNQVRL